VVAGSAPLGAGLETGAYKTMGFSRLSFPIEVGRVLDNFVSAVRLGRSDRLKILHIELLGGPRSIGALKPYRSA